MLGYYFTYEVVQKVPWRTDSFYQVRLLVICFCPQENLLYLALQILTQLYFYRWRLSLAVGIYNMPHLTVVFSELLPETKVENDSECEQ